jgi:hypothetical protein
MTRPIASELNFLQDVAPSVITPAVNSPSLSNERSIPHPVPISSVKDTEDQIDAALIDAVRSTRERMQVLNIENAILTFVKSRCVCFLFSLAEIPLKCSGHHFHFIMCYFQRRFLQ